VAVYLALDLILKHAAGLGQLPRHDEDLAAVYELAPLGTKRDPLTDDELVCWHRRYLARPVLLLGLRGFLALPGSLPLERVAALAFPSPASISRRVLAKRRWQRHAPKTCSTVPCQSPGECRPDTRTGRTPL